jgi:hypothetical protein
MEIINRVIENLNRETKSIKIFRKIEKKIGLETGACTMIVFSILFSMVFFDYSPLLICEIQSLVYPAYASLFYPHKYWYTYWVISSMLKLIFMILPNMNFLLSIRFLIIAFFSMPKVTKCIEIHNYIINAIPMPLSE